MTFKALKAIVTQGETQYVEFKRKASDPHKIMREVSAFANTEGGMLIIGVDDSKNILGLQYPEEELFVMENAMKKYCQPPVSYELARVKLPNDYEVLVFHIRANTEKPVYVTYNFRRHTGRAYLRIADKSIQASREARIILKAKTMKKNWKFTYGDKEKAVINFLANHPKHSIDDFTRSTGITKQKVSNIFIELTATGVLEIFPGEKKDLFALKKI